MIIIIIISRLNILCGKGGNCNWMGVGGGCLMWAHKEREGNSCGYSLVNWQVLKKKKWTNKRTKSTIFFKGVPWACLVTIWKKGHIRLGYAQFTSPCLSFWAQQRIRQSVPRRTKMLLMWEQWREKGYSALNFDGYASRSTTAQFLQALARTSLLGTKNNARPCTIFSLFTSDIFLLPPCHSFLAFTTPFLFTL